MVEAGANLTLPLKWWKQLIFLLCAFKRLLTSWWRSGKQGREKRGGSKSEQQGKGERVKR
jgi:membrane protein implicated in regulation of membrane protease activity